MAQRLAGQAEDRKLLEAWMDPGMVILVNKLLFIIIYDEKLQIAYVSDNI